MAPTTSFPEEQRIRFYVFQEESFSAEPRCSAKKMPPA